MIPQLAPNTTVDEFYRVLLAGAPIVKGKIVSFDAAATMAVQRVRHALGSVYSSGFLCSSDAAVGPGVGINVIAPEGQEDPQLYVYFVLTAATAKRGKLWVF